MLLISLLLTAIFFLVTKFTKLFCLIATTSAAALVLLSFESVAMAQRVPTLAPPEPNSSVSNSVDSNGAESNQSESTPDAISAPPLLVPQSLSQSKRFRSTTEETLPPPSGFGLNNESNPGSGPALKAPSNGSPSNRLNSKPRTRETTRAWTLPFGQHPWARFPNGAWRTFRIESESFDETGISLGRSTTIRTESLIHVGLNHYQLQISTLADVGGKRLPGTPQEVTLDLLTDGLIQPSSIEKQGTTTISLHGQAVPCTTWDLITRLDRGERHELVYYSAEQSPHVLRRERVDTIEGQVAGRKTTNIVRDGLPMMIGQTLQPCRHLLVTEQFASGGQEECFEVHSDSIPGGLVESTEVDYGPTGQRVRWATAELIGAGLQQGVPLFTPNEADSPSMRSPQFLVPRSTPSQLRLPQLQSPQREAPLGAPMPRRGRRDFEERDRDDDDDDDDRDDRDDDDDDDDDEIKPRRLLRLLRRAEVYLPADSQPVGESRSL